MGARTEEDPCPHERHRFRLVCAAIGARRKAAGWRPTDPAWRPPPGHSKPIRVKLVVTGGDDRSSVRVDGATMGQSPLITDFSCREGESVVVELTNSKGQARTYLRPCTPGTIRVEP